MWPLGGRSRPLNPYWRPSPHTKSHAPIAISGLSEPSRRRQSLDYGRCQQAWLYTGDGTTPLHGNTSGRTDFPVAGQRLRHAQDQAGKPAGTARPYADVVVRCGNRAHAERAPRCAQAQYAA
jgi:hypothetical protein